MAPVKPVEDGTRIIVTDWLW